MNQSVVRAACAALFFSIGISGCVGSSSAPPLPGRTLSTQSVAALAASSSPSLRAFTAGKTPGFPLSAIAWDVAGSNGTVWFTDTQTPGIGTIRGSTVREFNDLPPNARPYSIVAAADGDAWFTDAGNAAIGRISPSGRIVEFTSAQLSNTFPQGVAIAADGTVWFVSVGIKPVLASVAPHGGVVAHSLAPDLSPDGSLAADKSGNLWFVALTPSAHAVLVERKADGSFARFPTALVPGVEPCCPNQAPKRLAIGPDGNPYFTTLDYVHGNSPLNFIGKRDGSCITFIPVQNGSIAYAVYPSGITTAGDRLWFTGDDPFQLNGALWSLDTSGAMVAYPIPYNPVGVTTADAHHLWFTSHFGGQPSQIVEATLK